MADISKATQINNGLAIQVYNEQSCLLMEKRMRAAYQSAIDTFQKELDAFYEKYAKDNKIDLQVAKQKLSISESESVKELAEKYKKLLNRKRIGTGTQKLLDEIAAKTKVNRLEQLIVNCTKQASEVGMQAIDEMVDVGSLMYKDAFGHTVFNVQKTLGVGVNFNLPSARVIKTASNVEWLNATFTDRTGYALDRLTNNIEQIIPRMFIQGRNADELGKEVANQFNMSENAAKRDMRTLSTLITNQASILAYNNCEAVEEFEFVATLDGRTSNICRAMDGKRFKLNEAVPFVNQPPLHYNCRSTTIPYFSDLDAYSDTQRIARGEDDKTYSVPANMTYREWCTKHAQGLYANSDKTDWEYEPEKVLAYERIIDERRKLKALQDDRVTYQDYDFVVNHDISDYSDEEIDRLAKLYGVADSDKGALYNIVVAARDNAIAVNGGDKQFGEMRLYGYTPMQYELLWFIKSNLSKYKISQRGSDISTRSNFLEFIAARRDIFYTANKIIDYEYMVGDSPEWDDAPDIIIQLDKEALNNIFKRFDDAFDVNKGKGLIPIVDVEKQSAFLDMFNSKHVQNGKIDIYYDLVDVILKNTASFERWFGDRNIEIIRDLNDKLNFNEISRDVVAKEICNMYANLNLNTQQKIRMIKAFNSAMVTHDGKYNLQHLVDDKMNEIKWSVRILKPKITEYELSDDDMKIVFYDSFKTAYAYVNGTIDGFEEYLNNVENKKIDKRDVVQKQVSDMATKINDIRKALDANKAVPDFDKSEYNSVIMNLNKYYKVMDDEYGILNSRSNYQQFVKIMGMTERPETLPREAFKAYINENKDLPVLYRAVRDAGPVSRAGGIERGKYLRRGILNDLMYGSQQYIGDGVYGDGLYFSSKPTHQSYGSFSGSEETAINRKYMIQASFKNGTKIILYDDLQDLMREYQEKGYIVNDPSIFARSLGYQVIQAHRSNADEIYYNIIDRSCLVVCDVDKQDMNVSPEEQKRRLQEQDKREMRESLLNSDSLSVRALDFASKGQTPNLFSYNDIVSFKAATSVDELIELFKLASKKNLYTDNLITELKEGAQNPKEILDKLEALKNDNSEIIIDYFGKSIKVKKSELVKNLSDSARFNAFKKAVEDGTSEWDISYNAEGLSYELLAKLKMKFSSNQSIDEMQKLNSQLTNAKMLSDLHDGIDRLIDSAYNDVKDYMNKSNKNLVDAAEVKKQAEALIKPGLVERKGKFSKLPKNKNNVAAVYDLYYRDIQNMYSEGIMMNDNTMSKVYALVEALNSAEYNSDMETYTELLEANYTQIVNELKMKATGEENSYELHTKIAGTDAIVSVDADLINRAVDAINKNANAQRGALERLINNVKNVVGSYTDIVFDTRWTDTDYSDLYDIRDKYDELYAKNIENLFTYKIGNPAKVLTSDDLKALSRKDTYDFKELQRKALKEFKYYKGTMKKAEMQNERLRKAERITKNNEKYFQQSMKEIFEKNDFCMRLNKNVLPLIAESKFMNQFETGSAPLGLTYNKRRAVAKKMFTIPEDSPGSEYEKYGFLGSKNPKDDFKDDENFNFEYGDTIVRFKKKNLMHRTTFTIGDSLYNCLEKDTVRSSPVVNPQIASAEMGHVNEIIYGLNVLENADAQKNYLDIQALTKQKYIELQFHGDLTIDDVESVVFNKRNTNVNNPDVKKIIALLKERGIKCYLVDSKTEVIQEL